MWLTSTQKIKFPGIVSESLHPSIYSLTSMFSIKRLTFYIDLILAIIFCKLSLAFCKRGSSTAWKRKQKAFFGKNVVFNAPVYKMLAVILVLFS